MTHHFHTGERRNFYFQWKKIEAQWMYKRTLGTDRVEKLILEEGKLIINPVKPLNTPKEINTKLVDRV